MVQQFGLWFQILLKNVSGQLNNCSTFDLWHEEGDHSFHTRMLRILSEAGTCVRQAQRPAQSSSPADINCLYTLLTPMDTHKSQLIHEGSQTARLTSAEESHTPVLLFL